MHDCDFKDKKSGNRAKNIVYKKCYSNAKQFDAAEPWYIEPFHKTRKEKIEIELVIAQKKLKHIL